MNDIDLSKHYGPLNDTYANRIQQVIDEALIAHPRTMAIRVDLRLPQETEISSDSPSIWIRTDHKVITRFMAALTARLKAQEKRQIKSGRRSYPNTLRYVWAKEENQQHKVHYHLVLFFNKDAYHTLGNYQSPSPNLANRIRDSWASALGITNFEDMMNYRGLVHFPENPTYYLNRNSPTLREEKNKLRQRALYLAKRDTKPYNDRKRWFGTSRVFSQSSL